MVVVVEVVFDGVDTACGVVVSVVVDRGFFLFFISFFYSLFKSISPLATKWEIPLQSPNM